MPADLPSPPIGPTARVLTRTAGLPALLRAVPAYAAGVIAAATSAIVVAMITAVAVTTALTGWLGVLAIAPIALTALGLKPLRSGGPAALLGPIERELGGRGRDEERTVLSRLPGGPMEVTMIGEGDRKIAMIAYLLMNGSLAEDRYLLWDEPEVLTSGSGGRRPTPHEKGETRV